MLFVTKAPAQDLIDIQPIVNPLHQANMGKITFMGTAIPLENYQASDFLTVFELKPGADLNIRTFLSNSLTNEMHKIAPDLTAEALNQAGNFQFRFYVDQVLIYTENLHPGAFGTENKNKTTVFRVPFISAQNEDSWGRFLWMRFMARGGEDVLSDGEHRLKIEIRPYVNNGSLQVGSVMAQGELTIVSHPKPLPAKAIQIQKIKPHSDWSISNAPYNTQLIENLNEKIARNVFKDITSIVVIRNNNILIEEYFNKATRKTLHDTRSVGKTFTAALLGLAIKDGFIKDEQQPLSAFYTLQNYQNYTAAKGAVSLQNLLTMRSGFDGFDFDETSPGNEENMYPTDNWVKFALDLPMSATRKTGQDWAYFTAGVVVLGDILHRSVPGGLEQYAAQKLFKPLHIKSLKWQYTPQKVVNTAGSLQLSALDLAKFGQLYQNKGAWKGQQILPETWVRASLTNYTTTSDGSGYGYLFWQKTYTVHGKPYEVFYCSGNGGNKICIFKNIPLVIVLTAKAYGRAYAHPQADRIIEQYLLPAILD